MKNIHCGAGRKFTLLKHSRGFAFLEYDSHKSASTAKRKLSSGRSKVWNCDVIVDWADPIEEPDNVTIGAGRKFTLLKHSNSTSVFRGIPVTQSYFFL
jgi:hypothetical protein